MYSWIEKNEIIPVHFFFWCYVIFAEVQYVEYQNVKFQIVNCKK
jgi:hypothetical protein